MPLRYEKVETAQDIEKLAELAGVIWREYWPAHIGEAQTEYMIEMFQSVPAITKGIEEEGYLYYLAYDEAGKCVGYTGGFDEHFDSIDDPAANVHGTKVSERFLNRFYISKVYLLAEERGKHYATDMLNFWEDHCRANGLDGMYLQVNRHNELGVRAYLGRGFDVAEEVCSSIGEGFVMDDFIMAKAVEA